MALRLPLVSINGRTRELAAGDVLPGVIGYVVKETQPTGADYGRASVINGDVWYQPSTDTESVYRAGSWYARGGGSGIMYKKLTRILTSGNYVHPATALPGADVLLVGGGCGGSYSNTLGSAGGNTSFMDGGTVLLQSAGGSSTRPGTGGGLGARFVHLTSQSAAALASPAGMGLFGYGNGGGIRSNTSSNVIFPAAGTGEPSVDSAGAGDGGFSVAGFTYTNYSYSGGNGGGVKTRTLNLTPGATYTVTIGAGGLKASGGSGTGNGGNGVAEITYWDTVP